MKKPKISVVMSVYNGMPYLKDAVNSILRQTYKNFEFIIVDDASTDGTWSFLKSLNHRRIKLLKNRRNSGLASSLNLALKRASGDYIARMDADDISLPQRFEKQIEFLLKNPRIDLCGTWAKLIDEAGKETGEVKKPFDDKSIKRMNMSVTGIIHSSWLGKRAVFERLRGYDPRYDLAEDLDFLIRAKNFRMANFKEALLLWRSPRRRRSKRNIELMYRKSLEVRWSHFRNGNLSIWVLPYLVRSLITTFIFPSELKILLNKKAGLI